MEPQHTEAFSLDLVLLAPRTQFSEHIAGGWGVKLYSAHFQNCLFDTELVVITTT